MRATYRTPLEQVGTLTNIAPISGWGPDVVAIQNIVKTLARSHDIVSTLYSEYENTCFARTTDFCGNSALFLQWAGSESFTELAQAWKEVLDGFREAVPLGRKVETTYERLFDLDPVAAAFCKVKGLQSSVVTIHSLLRLCFSGIEDIKVEFVLDPEIPMDYKLSVRIKLHGDPDSILKSEQTYYAYASKMLSASERQHFILTYEVPS